MIDAPSVRQHLERDAIINGFRGEKFPQPDKLSFCAQLVDQSKRRELWQQLIVTVVTYFSHRLIAPSD